MNTIINKELRKAHEKKIAYITERLNKLRTISHVSQDYNELKEVSIKARNLRKACSLAMDAITTHKTGCTDELGECRVEYYNLSFKLLTREQFAERRSQEILAMKLRRGA